MENIKEKKIEPPKQTIVVPVNSKINEQNTAGVNVLRANRKERRKIKAKARSKKK